MDFSAKEDIEVPLDQVFGKISNFNQIERMAIRRGVDVQRTDKMADPGPGMGWKAGFSFRGKPREADITLTDYEPPTVMRFTSVSAGLNVEADIELVALSRNRTRVHMRIGLRPQTLSARLLVQSLKLARGRIDRKLSRRLAAFGRDLEDGRI